MRSRGGMSELMRQAQRMQRKMDKVRKELEEHEMSAQGAGGKIEVTATCGGKLRRIEVDEQFLAEEGIELTLDSVVAAANNALDAADKHLESELSKVTGGLKIPGLT
ncbi:MAG: YbaB/EbfC family nucleoid-associated protein [Deltaproteobacteria bacterium]|nr:YbaB/EbfC family nucleoid-associated protein [Deltaproteobacteria bacterium]